jgi:hypothetical protein
MFNEDQLFQPKGIDDQIEQLTKLSAQNAPGAPTLAALKTIYTEDDLTLTHAQDRIAGLSSTESTTEVLPANVIPLPYAQAEMARIEYGDRLPGGGFVPYSNHIYSERSPRVSRRRLGFIGLAVALALVFINIAGWGYFTAMTSMKSGISIASAATPVETKVFNAATSTPYSSNTSTPTGVTYTSCKQWIADLHPSYNQTASAQNNSMAFYGTFTYNSSVTGDNNGFPNANAVLVVHWPDSTTDTYEGITDQQGQVTFNVLLKADAIGKAAWGEISFDAANGLYRCNIPQQVASKAVFTEVGS